MKYLPLVGRVCFSAIFIFASFNHFRPATVQYAVDMGVPWAGFLVPLAGLMALIGGLSILLGFRARYGAALIAAFLIVVTPVMHAFWAAPDAATAMVQMAMFMKNLSMLGMTFFIGYFGSGPISLDAAWPSYRPVSVTRGRQADVSDHSTAA